MKDYMGSITEEEVQKFNAAISTGLNIRSEGLASSQEPPAPPQQITNPLEDDSAYDALYDENLKLAAQLDVYRNLYGELLSKLTA